jgi:hypothetical protein
MSMRAHLLSQKTLLPFVTDAESFSGGRDDNRWAFGPFDHLGRTKISTEKAAPLNMPQ